MTDPVSSMTGSGAASAEDATGRYTVELRSVNQRFLKTSVRAQGMAAPPEREVEEALRGRVQRGHVTAHVRFTPAPRTADLGVDEDAFCAAALRLRALAQECELAPVTVADVLRIPGVVAETTRAAPGEEERTPLRAALVAAVDELVASRRREGALLLEEVAALIARLVDHVASIALRAAEVPTAYRDRLAQRLQALLEGTEVRFDPDQLTREVALLADRSDVREEIARLEAHLSHAREVLDAGGAVGRRLDFLVQEMNREANTIGSKAADLALSRLAVEVKSDVERLREQVQNLE